MDGALAPARTQSLVFDRSFVPWAKSDAFLGHSGQFDRHAHENCIRAASIKSQFAAAELPSESGSCR
jgi:hypothetical protein